MSYPQSPYSAYQDAPLVNRPGCVTAFAILQWFGAAAYILGALALGIVGITDTSEYGVFFIPFALCIGAMAVIPLLIGLGLWKMKKWAWWPVVIFQALGVLGALSNLCGAFVTEDRTMVIPYIGGAILGGAINGLILYWFIQNRHRFNGVVTYQTITGPGGELIQQPVMQSSGMGAGTIALIVGIVFMVVLVPVCVIVVLALLGPAIGDVFSEIMLSI